MTNNNDRLRNSATRQTDRQHDEHRSIANEWLRRAITGIKEMHSSEDARREVAQRLF
jgi:hypothetical protein